VTVALCDTGDGAVILMNGNTDIEVLKNILVEAIADQYHWPGHPKTTLIVDPAFEHFGTGTRQTVSYRTWSVAFRKFWLNENPK